jgi:hypothetical protein
MANGNKFTVKGTSAGLAASKVKTPGSKMTPSMTSGFSKQELGKGKKGK